MRVALLQLGDMLAGRLFGQALHSRVEGGHNAQPTSAEQLGAVLLLQLLAHMKHKVGSANIDAGWPQLHRRRKGYIRLLPRQHVLLHHQVKHDPLALLGRLRIRERVKLGGRLDQPGQDRGFGQRQITGSLAEIPLCGGLNAVGHVAVIHFVEIKREDLVF